MRSHVVQKQFNKKRGIVVTTVIALVAIISYIYFFWSLCLSATSFLLNLEQQFPAVRPYLPYSVDSPAGTVEDGDMLSRIINNVIYLALFAGVHSLMARKCVKNILRNFYPGELERSIFTLQAAFFLHLVQIKWQPISDNVWTLPESMHLAVHAIYVFGVLFLVTATFAIDHFSLFGLRQGLRMGKFLSISHDGLVLDFAHFKLVRHPLMTGYLIMFWAVPVMSVGHLLFSIVASAYIFIAVKLFEEPDLIAEIGQRYVKYMETTPGFCPFMGGTGPEKQNQE